jgi:hypothetical protein
MSFMKRILINAAMILTIATSLAAIAAAQTGKSDADCTGPQLSLKEGEPEADIGGKRYARFVFTNISPKACTLSGFPKFALLGKTGRLLSGVKVSYSNDFPGGESDSPESRVTLGPGETAWFQIFYNDGMALERRKKPFPVAAKVGVKAPNTTRNFILKSEIQACCGVQVSSIRGGLPQ